MTTANAAEDQNLVVDPLGDVILVAGVTPLQLSLQVSSHVLSLASNVFKAMFGAHFQEGRRIKATSETTVTVPLPDDDPEAAGLACRILHYRIDNTLENPNLELLAKLATFGDKYDCVQSLRPSTQRWFQELQSGIHRKGYHDLLVLSYQFDDPELFQKLTMNMVLEHDGSFLLFILNYGQDILPVSLAMALEEKRTKLHTRVFSALESVMAPFLACPHSPSHNHDIAGILRELYRIGVYPMRFTASVATTLQQIQSFGTVSVTRCGQPGCKPGSSISDATKKIAADGRTWAEGACLDCIRHGGRKGGRCRIRHF